MGWFAPWRFSDTEGPVSSPAGELRLLGRATAEPGKDDRERDQRTGRHEYGREEWVHAAGEAEGDGHDVVGDGKGNHGTGGPAALGRDFQQSADATQATT